MVDRIHLENARASGRHGVQSVAQYVACAALTLVVRQSITNLSAVMVQSFNDIRASVDAATRDMEERCFVSGSLT